MSGLRRPRSERHAICRSQAIRTALLVAACLVWAAPPGQAASLRFFGHGVGDIDRVKIRIDDPVLPADPGPPIDVGDGDWTIEFWVRGTVADNQAPAISCGGNYDWIFGNILFDRDRYSQGRAFGLSFHAGRIAFGINDASQIAETICSSTVALDGSWHHVSLARRRSDGWLWLHLDGVLEAQANGPDGDVSYPDSGVPNSLCGPTGGDPCTASDPFIVLGAEKHDAGVQFPSFSGSLDELRISTNLRYAGANFSPPTAPFVTDASTVGLFHFDEQGSGNCTGTVTDSSAAAGGATDGVCSFGGVAPAGPIYEASSPFAATAPSVPSTSLPLLGLLCGGLLWGGRRITEG